MPKHIFIKIILFIFRFVVVLKSLDMNIPSLRVSEHSISSLAIHPSVTSLIIAAGDCKGNICEAKYIIIKHFILYYNNSIFINIS